MAAAQVSMAAHEVAHRVLLPKLRCITVDVTGTLIAYKGVLGDYYCMAAKAMSLPCPDYTRMHEGFKVAYTDMATKYPCFGQAARMPNVEWWRMCVRNSFLEVCILTLSLSLSLSVSHTHRQFCFRLFLLTQMRVSLHCREVTYRAECTVKRA